jgi:ABC1 atypical kinase-like domain
MTGPAHRQPMQSTQPEPEAAASSRGPRPAPVMPPAAPRPGPGEAARERQHDRREVERRLAAAGWRPRRRRHAAESSSGAAGSAAAADEHERFATALRQAIEAVAMDLPIFAAFGRYLGTRPDLTGIAGAELLAAIPDRSSPAAAADVAALLAAELGGVPGELFAGFETAPYAARLLVESHHALSPDGRPLDVHLAWPAQPDLAAALAAEIDLLPLLAPGLPLAGFPLDEAIADFRAAVAGELDFRGAAEALESIAAAAGPTAAGGPRGPLAVPAVERERTSARVLTVESPAGGSWEELAADPGRRAVAYGFARRLSLGWLELALTGSRLPVAASLRARGDGRIALGDGVFVAADGAAQVNLTAYVRAAARDDAEAVASCLLREVEPARAQRHRDADLGKRLRQAVPFRDSDLSGGSVSWGTEGLAGQLLTHWQLIHRCGYRPRPYLRELYRGLLWLSRAGGLMAPGRDPLRDALEDFDWRSARAGLYRSAEPERAAELLESYLVTLASLPQQVDQALARLAGSPGAWPAMTSPPPSAAGDPLAAGTAGDAGDQHRRDASAAVAALGMSMAALAILLEKLLAAGAPAWLGATGAVVFLILGALLLRAAGARR